METNQLLFDQNSNSIVSVNGNTWQWDSQPYNTINAGASYITYNTHSPEIQNKLDRLQELEAKLLQQSANIRKNFPAHADEFDEYYGITTERRGRI